MNGVTRIGDHFIDENEGYESDQLRDDYAENKVPEPLDPILPPPWTTEHIEPTDKQ